MQVRVARGIPRRLSREGFWPLSEAVSDMQSRLIRTSHEAQDVIGWNCSFSYAVPNAAFPFVYALRTHLRIDKLTYARLGSVDSQAVTNIYGPLPTAIYLRVLTDLWKNTNRFR